MSYLQRLKELDSEKQPPRDLQEVQKDHSYSFCSTKGEHFSRSDTKKAPFCTFYSNEDSQISKSGEDGQAEPDFSKTPTQGTAKSAKTKLTNEEEAKIIAWLESINETDQAIVHETLKRCQEDHATRRYFLSHSILLIKEETEGKFGS